MNIESMLKERMPRRIFDSEALVTPMYQISHQELCLSFDEVFENFEQTISLRCMGKHVATVGDKLNKEFKECLRIAEAQS